MSYWLETNLRNQRDLQRDAIDRSLASRFAVEKLSQTYTSFLYSPHTGLPQSIICDRDGKFISKFWETLMQQLRIDLDMSTAFHPQIDGSTEIANKTIIQILRNWVSVKQR